MARRRMTRSEYGKKSNSHYRNGSHAKPDYKHPHQQSGYGYNFQKVIRKNIIGSKKTSKLVRMARGA